MSKGFFNWLDDESYIRLSYRLKIGKKINLDQPSSFNEKIQWLKLHDRKDEYSMMVDKYESKRFVASIIGHDYIVPTFGVWDRYEDVDFDSLPKQFVMKCTHDSGGLVICKDKSSFDYEEAQCKINASLRRNYYLYGREWPYKNVKPRIIVEQYLLNSDVGSEGLIDYKFFCFNGVPKFIYVSRGLDNHSTASISFYDLTGKKMPFKRTDYNEMEGDELVLPTCFGEMLEIATKLAIETTAPFIRVDLYAIAGKPLFSELTFAPCGGLLPFCPETADEEVGALLSLPL